MTSNPADFRWGAFSLRKPFAQVRKISEKTKVERWVGFGRLQRQSQSRFAPPSSRAVFERRHSAVAFGDLAAERQFDPRFAVIARI